MQLDFYNALKTQIETLTSLKYVALWNNQFDRESENVAFGYPCVFIEFTNVAYTDFLNGQQKYNMNVNLHLGFESLKTEDTAILQLKQDLQAVVFQFQQGYETKMLRRSETPNYDHPNIQEYIITYSVSGKDYANNLPTTEVTATLDLTTELVITNDTIKTASPTIP